MNIKAMSLFGMLLFAVGCASTTVMVQTATRYSWACPGGSCDSAQLTRDHSQCTREGVEWSTWVPYLGVNGVLKARYKDCMENRGYTLTRSTDVRYEAPYGNPLRPAPKVGPPGSGEVDLMMRF